MDEYPLKYAMCYDCYYVNNAIARAKLENEVSEFEGNKITPCRKCDGVLLYEPDGEILIKI